jgi:hypothetical protein
VISISTSEAIAWTATVEIYRERLIIDCLKEQGSLLLTLKAWSPIDVMRGSLKLCTQFSYPVWEGIRQDSQMHGCICNRTLSRRPEARDGVATYIIPCLHYLNQLKLRTGRAFHIPNAATAKTDYTIFSGQYWELCWKITLTIIDAILTLFPTECGLVEKALLMIQEDYEPRHKILA